MKILFTGDLFLGGDLARPDYKYKINSSSFSEADVRIANLEQAISDASDLADKCTLFSDSSSIYYLKQMNIQAVNLANNHIQDKKEIGIKDTINFLDREKIGHFGAGKNLLDAKEPFWIDETTCILGYCDFKRPYLTQVQIAGDDTPGVNPLRFELVVEDLNKLAPGKKAILYFHWGREYVWFPPRRDIQLAKRLLEDERVALIIGTHCHRIQGFLEHNGKRAYMSLGNFLFPNFFIEPPMQIAYPEIMPHKCPVTRQYHSVDKLTYGKFPLICRISLMVEYNSQNFNIHHIPVIQDDDAPHITELHGIKRKLTLLWIAIFNRFYQLPEGMYNPIEKTNTFLFYKFWNAKIILFYIRQKGFALMVKNFFW